MWSVSPPPIMPRAHSLLYRIVSSQFHDASALSSPLSHFFNCGFRPNGPCFIPHYHTSLTPFTLIKVTNERKRERNNNTAPCTSSNHFTYVAHPPRFSTSPFIYRFSSSSIFFFFLGCWKCLMATLLEALGFRAKALTTKNDEILKRSSFFGLNGFSVLII